MSGKLLRILALDVAFTHTGVAVLEYNKETKAWDIAYTTCIVTKKETKKRKTYETDDKVRRVRIICRELAAVIKEWQPILISAELPSSGGQSAAAHASMGMAIAVVTCVAELLDIPLRSYTWDDIKLMATNKNSAGKALVQAAIVERWPNLAEEYASSRSKTKYTGNFEHIADAIGAGLCSLDSDVIQAVIQAVHI